MSNNVKKVMSKLLELSDGDFAVQSQRFFKTAKGEYAEGDRFLGVRVPILRTLIKEYLVLTLDEILTLLDSPIHEARMLAVLLLVAKYRGANSSAEKLKIYRAYLSCSRYINNWDLVDASAAQIVGDHLFQGDKKILYKLSQSKDLWERRISIVATHFFIKNDSYADTLAISERLLADKEDLIHKAVGWMLREVGKRDRETLDAFLVVHYRAMARTTLRYAIEQHTESDRQAYLKGKK